MSRPPQRWTAHHNDRGETLPEVLLTLVCYGSNSVLSSLGVQVQYLDPEAAKDAIAAVANQGK